MKKNGPTNLFSIKKKKKKKKKKKELNIGQQGTLETTWNKGQKF